MRSRDRLRSLAIVAGLAGMVLVVGCAPSGGGGGGDDDDGIDGGGDDDDPDSGGGGEVCTSGLGDWTGTDDVRPSQDPPCGLPPSAVPLFVGLGFDDNGSAEGMAWAVSMLQDRQAQASFYMTSTYGAQDAIKQSWKAAAAADQEIGNHTVQHLDGAAYTAADWNRELTGCTTFLDEADVAPASEVVGFRTPFLAYNDAMLETVDALDLWYDTSIEEGYEDGQDGTNFYWPYTLDNRSPGHTVQVSWGKGKVEISPRPGLWEMPVYAVFVPPDDKCEEYGVPSGLRDRLKLVQSWFDTDSGAITGFDYNLWAVRSAGGFEMTKAEFLATMKYSFDQRLKGNRAPFLFGAHAAYYVDSWNANSPGAPTARERQETIEEFLDYAKAASPATRIITVKAILEWIRNPVAL